MGAEAVSLQQDAVLRDHLARAGQAGKWSLLSSPLLFFVLVGFSQERTRERAEGKLSRSAISTPRDAGQAWGSSALRGILQKGGPAAFPAPGGQRWRPAALPRAGRAPQAGETKEHFPLFFLSFISWAETDSIRCKTKCQEKDVCCSKMCCCRRPARCLSQPFVLLLPQIK